MNALLTAYTYSDCHERELFLTINDFVSLPLSQNVLLTAYTYSYRHELVVGDSCLQPCKSEVTYLQIAIRIDKEIALRVYI